ncbi:hypothetical protein BJ878DRAFT_53452 [Calycina marina]|uniref:J domain-containing protein n=1 Tax=Calycina marina TaxID=1763456 RepID=A0A9P7Z3S3_9HELO|nr:hypothetical protein BJ878DRAFT_53452 [Calycina marina]
MSGQLVSLAAWTFLPNMATGWLQSIYYGIMIRAGDVKPQPGSPRYLQHRRRIYIIVVSAYLLYTIYEADWEIRRASDYYQDLGAAHSATEKEIKSKFRRMAAKFHPDKVTGPTDGEAYFVHLKEAQDALVDPVKRFAYERFGPDSQNWKDCASIREYVQRGVRSVILPYYGVTAIVMYILSLVGYLDWGKYWRWITLLCLCIFEIHTISRPFFPVFAEKALNPMLLAFTSRPPYLPFQLIQLARKIALTIFIAFSQIGPLLEPPTPGNAPKSNNPEVQLNQNLTRLEEMAKLAKLDADRAVMLEMVPFMGDEVATGALRGKIKTWLVQNTVRSDPMVKDALGRSLQKRRTDAPIGAKGNR